MLETLIKNGTQRKKNINFLVFILSLSGPVNGAQNICAWHSEARRFKSTKLFILNLIWL